MSSIRTCQDYENALETIEELMGAKGASSEGGRLIVLVAEIEAYEARHFAIDMPGAA